MSFATCVSQSRRTPLGSFAFRRNDRSGDEDDTIHNFAIWEAVVRRLALVRSARAATPDLGGSFAGGSA
jgi:hypothetical protein